MTSSYVFGLDVLGAAGSGVAFGPLSPEQLSKVDRALTPAEQKAVSDWQSKQSEAILVEERKKGGPQSTTVSVTKEGAVIRSEAPRPTTTTTAVETGIPTWQIVLGAIGVVAISAGIYKLVSDTRPTARARYA